MAPDLAPTTVLETAAEVMAALGPGGEDLGIQAVADLTGSGYKSVHNWRTANAFPPKTYVVLTEALRLKGLSAPRSLWPAMLDSPPAAPTEARAAS